MGRSRRELEYEIRRSGYVERVSVHREPRKRCGYDYAMHFGATDGYTVVRYDNSHEEQGVYDEHLCGSRYVHPEFPGLSTLLDRFYWVKNVYVRWKGVEGKTP